MPRTPRPLAPRVLPPGKARFAVLLRRGDFARHLEAVSKSSSSPACQPRRCGAHRPPGASGGRVRRSPSEAPRKPPGKAGSQPRSLCQTSEGLRCWGERRPEAARLCSGCQWRGRSPRRLRPGGPRTRGRHRAAQPSETRPAKARRGSVTGWDRRRPPPSLQAPNGGLRLHSAPRRPPALLTVSISRGADRVRSL